jgi:hypothetical protein
VKTASVNQTRPWTPKEKALVSAGTLLFGGAIAVLGLWLGTNKLPRFNSTQRIGLMAGLAAGGVVGLISSVSAACLRRQPSRREEQPIPRAPAVVEADGAKPAAAVQLAPKTPTPSQTPMKGGASTPATPANTPLPSKTISSSPDAVKSPAKKAAQPATNILSPDAAKPHSQVEVPPGFVAARLVAPEAPKQPSPAKQPQPAPAEASLAAPQAPKPSPAKTTGVAAPAKQPQAAHSVTPAAHAKVPSSRVPAQARPQPPVQPVATQPSQPELAAYSKLYAQATDQLEKAGFDPVSKAFTGSEIRNIWDTLKPETAPTTASGMDNYGTLLLDLIEARKILRSSTVQHKAKDPQLLHEASKTCTTMINQCLDDLRASGVNYKPEDAQKIVDAAEGRLRAIFQACKDEAEVQKLINRKTIPAHLNDPVGMLQILNEMRMRDLEHFHVWTGHTAAMLRVVRCQATLAAAKT